jgi:photosystem II stability/assembly factor-like uncharacterized protein
MNPDHDTEELETRLRSSFERTRVPAAPSSIRTHASELRARPKRDPWTARGTGRLLAAAVIAIVALGGTVLFVGSHAPLPSPSPAASPTPKARNPSFVPPGPLSLFVPDQATSGDGWQLLGGAARLPGPQVDKPLIELYTDGGIAKALDTLGLADPNPAVSDQTDVVVMASIITGDDASNPGCGRIRLDGVTVDLATGSVTVRYEPARTEPNGAPLLACRDQAVPARFAIAMPIGRLPQGRFALRLLRSTGTEAVIESDTTASAPASLPPTASGSIVDEAGTFPKGGIWARTGRILRTTNDGGQSWHRIALQVDPIRVFLLDESVAWVVSAGPGSVWPYGGQGELDTLHLVVSRTSDSGQTWTASKIDGNFGGTVPVLRFADLEHGYLLAAGLRSGPATSLLETSDGGATWSRMSIATLFRGQLGSNFAIGPNGWLWAGNQGDAGPVARPILDVSRDGGRTWTDAELPGLEGDAQANDYVLGPPAFFGSDGVVAVATGGEEGLALVYRTSDDGAHWQHAGGFTGGTAFGAAARDVWYLATTSGFAKTGDGGATWQTMMPTGVSGGGINSLAFSDPNGGAAAVAFGDGTPPAALYLTRDAGLSWQPADFGAGG